MLAATLAIACDSRKAEPGASEAGQRACAEAWKAINGSIEATQDDCSAFVATSAGDAGALDYWSGSFELSQKPKGTAIDFVAAFSRPQSDDVYPVELVVLGGHFGAAQGRFFFWEGDDHWTGWQATAVPFTQPLELRVRQRGPKLEGFINGALVGTFTLNRSPAVGPVGVFFKGAKGTASKVGVARVKLTDIL